MFPSIQAEFTGPPPKVQISQNSTSIENITPTINFDFKENSPFQEGVMS